MELKDQVPSKKLSQRLRELGVKQESLFHHVSYLNLGVEEHDIYSEEKVVSAGNEGWQLTSICSAFTVAELGEMLKEVKYQLPHYTKSVTAWFPDPHFPIGFSSNVEADCRALMLIYLLENKLILN